MTVEELNALIARGATQPGVRELEELMRLSCGLDKQARELAALYSESGWLSTSSNSSGSMTPTVGANANMG